MENVWQSGHYVASAVTIMRRHASANRSRGYHNGYELSEVAHVAISPALAAILVPDAFRRWLSGQLSANAHLGCLCVYQFCQDGCPPEYASSGHMGTFDLLSTCRRWGSPPVLCATPESITACTDFVGPDWTMICTPAKASTHLDAVLATLA